MKPLTQEEPTETIGLRTKTGTPQSAFRLSVTAGPDAPAELVIDGAAPARVLVGTSPACQLRLTDRAVSRRHLALSLQDGRLAVEDLGTTNGTFVGSLAIEDVRLEGGESIFLGSTRIQVERLTTEASIAVARATNFGRVVGSSVPMRRLFLTFARFAASPLPILIEGEMGTGKELVAEAIHEEGPRRQGEFVVIEAGRTSDTDIDRVLFGSASGPGAVESAHGGTLVVDEPSELPLATQAKLVQLIERRPIVRDDGTPLPPGVDVRLIVLSRSDLDQAAQTGLVKEELAGALAPTRIELPPLRDRLGDITLLATMFFRELALEDRFMSPLTLRRFEAYSWPGNVRELKSAVVRYGMTGEDGADPQGAYREAGHEQSPDELCRHVLGAGLSLAQAREVIVEDFERRYVRMILDRHGGNVTRAAAASGLARRYFQVLRNKRRV